MKINLFTNWYSSYRDEENEACLMVNIENPKVNKIYLFCDDGKKFPNYGVPEYEKIVGIRLDQRLTYNTVFDVVNASEPEISIIANSDIYFDSSLGYLKFLDENTCYALTRWDDTLNGCFFYNRWDSQDVWVFKGNIKNVKADFELGRLGCDNRLVYELRQAQYMVSNPSKTIKAHHLHLEERKENANHDKSKTIPPPYEYVLPIEIIPFMSIITRHYYKRPNLFKNCCNSVQMQKDQDFEHVIIEDNVGVGSLQANQFFFENKERVHGKYVFMLDDDDMFTTDEFVNDMKKIVYQYNPTIIFIRMLINDNLYPTAVNWKQKELQRNHIGTSNVVVRNDIWKKYIHTFSAKQIGDFEFIKNIYESVSSFSVYWQDKVYSKTVKVSRGKPE